MGNASKLAIIAALVGGCDRPDVLVICHNSNCVEPTDPANDDSLFALRQSLALEVDGLPAIDGTEIDSFWRGSDGTCLFAHDLLGVRDTTISQAADELAAHITAGGALTRSGKPFR